MGILPDAIAMATWVWLIGVGLSPELLFPLVSGCGECTGSGLPSTALAGTNYPHRWPLEQYHLSQLNISYRVVKIKGEEGNPVRTLSSLEEEIDNKEIKGNYRIVKEH